MGFHAIVDHRSQPVRPTVRRARPIRTDWLNRELGHAPHVRGLAELNVTTRGPAPNATPHTQIRKSPTCYGVALAVTIGAIFVRRRMQPLKARDPYMLITVNAATYIGCLFLRTTSCWLSELGQVSFLALFMFVLARFWKLLFAASLTKARLSGDLNVWILRHPWVASSRFIWASALGVTAMLAAAHVGVAVRSSACQMSQAASLIFCSATTAWWLTVAVLTVRLRHIQDGFYLVTELRALGAYIVISNSLIMIALAFEISQVRFQLGMIGVGIGHMAIQMWYPLWRSFSLDQACDRKDPPAPVLDPSANSSTAPLRADADFLQILQHPDGFAALQTFLTLEFSVENLLLWKQLHEHLGDRRPEQIAHHFRQIYDLFIREQAPNEVNISSHLKSQFRQVIEAALTPLPELQSMDGDELRTDVMTCLLQQLYFDIVELIKADSYRRFKQSDQYQHMLLLSQNRLVV